MKKIYLVWIFVSIVGFARAQEENPVSEKRQQNIEALKVAFLSKELDLTPEEAQKFWPVYNQYSKELNTTLRDEKDVLVREEKTLNIRKKYRDQFSNVLGQPRMNRVFNAEIKFREVLLRSVRNQNLRNKANRQFQRQN